ncbi:hypothetical protein [Streptomyces viridochromogenes]|uniref:Uncharacterized protein n=1 Tax=Streptomyces viridochromogenes Tue57 TaxID=1160705 RepID=L8P6C3_STRVR|nr:hypothetical protein [Streptomyces viridochromogenes]ELS50882.1 hypothetical protein STVIR_8157 [Streptomyces viridochromogenes Tue57]
MSTAHRRVLRLTADAIRALVLGSAVFVAITPRDGAVILTLLFLALLVPRLTRLPAVLDLLLCAVLAWAAWSSVFHWYRTVGWYDTAVHAVTPGVVAATLHVLLARLRLLPSPADRALRRAATPLLTTALGATVASLWEMYEWLATDVFGARLRVGYEDTIADLAAGVSGSLAAGLVLAWRAAHGSLGTTGNGRLTAGRDVRIKRTGG